MKANNIFKATELIKYVPSVVTAIDTEDWHHVCIIEDPVKEAYFILSYIWDTRDITRFCLIYTGCDLYDAIKQFMTSEDKANALADDNLTRLNIRDYETLEWHDYIAFANKEIMTEPVQFKVKAKDNKVLMNGFEVAELTKNPDYPTGGPFESKYILRWNKLNMQNLLGLMPNEDNGKNWYDNHFDRETTNEHTVKAFKLGLAVKFIALGIKSNL